MYINILQDQSGTCGPSLKWLDAVQAGDTATILLSA